MVTVCHLIQSEPLPELMIICSLDILKQFQRTRKLKIKNNIQDSAFEKVILTISLGIQKTN